MSEPQNKFPPGRRPAAMTGTGPRLTQSPALAPQSDAAPPSEVAEIQSAPASIPPPGGTRLKIVTISPGRSSFADTEMPTAQRMAARNDPYLGATIDGRYRVEAVLGEGGMGVVYRCSHTIIGKKVAMKVLRSDLARDSEVTERFLNEAKSASQIGNPHIIDISDFGQFADGATYFVMEFLAGTPLSRAMDNVQVMPLPRIIHIARQLAEGLEAAHEAGIVHRDLKPDNIFLIDRGGEKDFVKILDFGIAKVSTTGEGRLTRAGAVFGTPHYMSPEQAAGAPVDHRGDVYSLGVILYEMASGRVPFDADNFMGILTQHMYKAPVPMRALVPPPVGIPPGLEAIVLKSLSKRPEDRYQTMAELTADLDRLKSGLVPSAVTEMMRRSAEFSVPADYFNRAPVAAPATGTPLPAVRKRRWPLAVAIVGLAAMLGVLTAMLVNGNQSARVTPSAPPVAKEAPAAPPPVIKEQQPPAAVPTMEVMLAADPLEAHVFQGSRDLGQSPLNVTVTPGKPVELEIRLSGYKTKKLVLDGTEKRKIVELERSSRPTAYRAPRTQKPAEKTVAAPKKAKVVSPGIVNPWD